MGRAAIGLLAFGLLAFGLLGPTVVSGIPSEEVLQQLMPELEQAGQRSSSIYSPITSNWLGNNPPGVEGNGAPFPLSSEPDAPEAVPDYKLVPGSIRALKDIEKSMEATGRELETLPAAPRTNLAYGPNKKYPSKLQKLKANLARKVQLMEIGALSKRSRPLHGRQHFVRPTQTKFTTHARLSNLQSTPEISKPVDLRKFMPAVSTPIDISKFSHTQHRLGKSSPAHSSREISKPVRLSQYAVSHIAEISKPVDISKYSISIPTPEISSPVHIPSRGKRFRSPLVHVPPIGYGPAHKRKQMARRRRYPRYEPPSEQHYFPKLPIPRTVSKNKRTCLVHNPDFSKGSQGSLAGWDTEGEVEFERDTELDDGTDAPYYVRLKGKGSVLSQKIDMSTGQRATLHFKAATREGIERGTFSVFINGEQRIDTEEPPSKFKSYSIPYDKEALQWKIEFKNDDPPPGTGGNGDEATVLISEVTLTDCGPTKSMMRQVS